MLSVGMRAHPVAVPGHCCTFMLGPGLKYLRIKPLYKPFTWFICPEPILTSLGLFPPPSTLPACTICQVSKLLVKAGLSGGHDERNAHKKARDMAERAQLVGVRVVG